MERHEESQLKTCLYAMAFFLQLLVKYVPMAATVIRLFDWRPVLMS